MSALIDKYIVYILFYYILSYKNSFGAFIYLFFNFNYYNNLYKSISKIIICSYSNIAFFPKIASSYNYLKL